MDQRLKKRPEPADLETLEKRLQNIQDRLDRFAKLLKGNGDTGLLGQVFQNSERIANLQAQWKWMVVGGEEMRVDWPRFRCTRRLEGPNLRR